MAELSHKILQLEKKYRISTPVINYLYQTFPSYSTIQKILESITTAPKYYFLRLNLTKMNPVGFLAKWQQEFPDFISEVSPLDNSLKIEIKSEKNFILEKDQVYCDKFAAEAVMIGADLFMPGVTGMNGKIPTNTKVSIILSPDHRPEPWKKYSVSYHVANGIAVQSSMDYVKYRNGVFVKNTNSRYTTPKYRSHAFFEQGLISEQAFPPNFAMAWLMLKKIEKYPSQKVTILDLCAAPGHKTTAMAEWHYYLTSKLGSPEWATILAIDRSSNRLKHLSRDTKRLNLQNISLIACKLEKISEKYPNLLNTGDVVMFDPPCSALGTRPKIYIQETEAHLQDYSKNQQRLIPYVDSLVKPGGLLMYNTCTLNIEENEAIIAVFLTKYNYELIPVPSRLIGIGNHGLAHPDLSPHDLTKMRRFLPFEEFGTGYFCALLVKRE
jgi:16S rRNA (cytosine967-C5)-methyltransferase